MQQQQQQQQQSIHSKTLGSASLTKLNASPNSINQNMKHKPSIRFDKETPRFICT